MKEEIENLIEDIGKISCCGCCYSEHDISEELRKAYELGKLSSRE